MEGKTYRWDHIDENKEGEQAKQMQAFDVVSICCLGDLMKFEADTNMRWLAAVKKWNK